MARGQGSLLVSCNPSDSDDDDGMSCGGWLFGGSVGLTVHSPVNANDIGILDKLGLDGTSIAQDVTSTAYKVVGVPMNDLWFVDAAMLLGVNVAVTNEELTRGLFYYRGPASLAYLNDVGTPLFQSRFKHPTGQVDSSLISTDMTGTLWPAARAGHAAWLDGDGWSVADDFKSVNMPKLFVFGGVGASPFGSAAEQGGCLVMQDLWRYSPLPASDENGFIPSGGSWLQLSNGPDFQRSMFDAADQGARACEASLLIQLPWLNQGTVARSGEPIEGYTNQHAGAVAPAARTNAMGWRENGHFWLFGGDYPTSKDGGNVQLDPVLQDMWRLDGGGNQPVRTSDFTSVSPRAARTTTCLPGTFLTDCVWSQWHRANDDLTGVPDKWRSVTNWGPSARTAGSVFTLADGATIVLGGMGWTGTGCDPTEDEDCEADRAVALTDAWMRTTDDVPVDLLAARMEAAGETPAGAAGAEDGVFTYLFPNANGGN